MPNAAASRTCAQAREARMRAFEGTHPTLRQSPPSRCFSTRATRAPNPAAPEAVTRPAVPAPITTRLYRPVGSGLTQSGGCTFWTSARLNSSSGWIVTGMLAFSMILLNEARRTGTLELDNPVPMSHTSGRYEKKSNRDVSLHAEGLSSPRVRVAPARHVRLRRGKGSTRRLRAESGFSHHAWPAPAGGRQAPAASPDRHRAVRRCAAILRDPGVVRKQGLPGSVQDAARRSGAERSMDGHDRPRDSRLPDCRAGQGRPGEPAGAHRSDGSRHGPHA